MAQKNILFNYFVFLLNVFIFVKYSINKIFFGENCYEKSQLITTLLIIGLFNFG